MSLRPVGRIPSGVAIHPLKSSVAAAPRPCATYMFNPACNGQRPGIHPWEPDPLQTNQPMRRARADKKDGFYVTGLAGGRLLAEEFPGQHHPETEQSHEGCDCCDNFHLSLLTLSRSSYYRISVLQTIYQLVNSLLRQRRLMPASMIPL